MNEINSDWTEVVSRVKDYYPLPRSKEACDYIEKVALAHFLSHADCNVDDAIFVGIRMHAAINTMRQEAYGQSDE